MNFERIFEFSLIHRRNARRATPVRKAEEVVLAVWTKSTFLSRDAPFHTDKDLVFVHQGFRPVSGFTCRLTRTAPWIPPTTSHTTTRHIGYVLNTHLFWFRLRPWQMPGICSGCDRHCAIFQPEDIAKHSISPASSCR